MKSRSYGAAEHVHKHELLEGHRSKHPDGSAADAFLTVACLGHHSQSRGTLRLQIRLWRRQKEFTLFSGSSVQLPSTSDTDSSVPVALSIQICPSHSTPVTIVSFPSPSFNPSPSLFKYASRLCSQLVHFVCIPSMSNRHIPRLCFHSVCSRLCFHLVL